MEFVPILYDDVFQRIMEHWKKLADGLTESIPVVPGFLEKGRYRDRVRVWRSRLRRESTH